MTTTDSIKYGAGLAVLTTLAGISYYALTAGQTRVGVWSTVLAPAAAQQAFAALAAADDGGNVVVHNVGPVALADAGSQWPAQVYARVKICALPVDGGQDPGPGVVPGLTIVYDDDGVANCTATEPTIQAWADSAAAPWLCACALPVPDAGGCIWVQTQPGGAVVQSQAPYGVTIAAGNWSGPGCRPKPCVELAGVSSWPAECPAQ